jgi:hypothetical protein
LAEVAKLQTKGITHAAIAVPEAHINENTTALILLTLRKIPFVVINQHLLQCSISFTLTQKSFSQAQYQATLMQCFLL